MTGRHLQVVGSDAGGAGAPAVNETVATTIRRAVHVLRGRAAMAMPGPWTAWPAGGRNAEVVTSDTAGLTVGVAPPPIEDVGWSVSPGTADFIAMMGPNVAEAIAVWLDDVVTRMHESGVSPAETGRAYDVARQILREVTS